MTRNTAHLKTTRGKKQALVSIVMPVYNANRHLRAAIESMLTQTYDDFEFIIIDDGSSDGSSETIKSYSDRRIRHLVNASNRGLIYTLNRGFQEASGEFIARMDADDISLPTRLERQVDYMTKHPKCAVLGTWFRLSTGEDIQHPLDHEDIKLALLTNNNAIGHPTAMVRRTAVDQNLAAYSHKFRHAEDYGLWVHLILKHDFANINEILLMYRIHEGQISNIQSRAQARSAEKARTYVFARSFPLLSWRQILLWRRMKNPLFLPSTLQMIRICILVGIACSVNCLLGKFSRGRFLLYMTRQSMRAARSWWEAPAKTGTMNTQ